MKLFWSCHLHVPRQACKTKLRYCSKSPWRFTCFNLSLSLWLHCCIPLRVISITEKLALVIPNRDCSFLLYHLSNARECCVGKPNIWISSHWWQLKTFVFDSYSGIVPKTRKGQELKTPLHNLNMECSDNNFFSNTWAGDQNSPLLYCRSEPGGFPLVCTS